MSGSRFIAVMAALIDIVAVCVLGLYLYQRDRGPAQTAGNGAIPGATPGQQSQGKPADAAPKGPTSVPSFDVVRVEKSGDGVMAGRAQPGWSVKVATGGTVVAETTADEEGAWTVILEEPLAPGDHELTVTATSPDGTSSLSSQDAVKVAVADTKKQGEDIAALTEAVNPTEPEGGTVSPAAPQDNATAPDAAATDQTSTASNDEIPGDRSLIENPYQRPASELAAVASGQAEQPSQMAEADIPGDRSLIQPSTQAPASEPAATEAPSAAGTETPSSAPAEEQAADQSGEVPGDKSLIERSASDPTLPEATPEGSHNSKPPVVFKTVDYQDTGPETGKVTAGGAGHPGAQIRLYFDDQPVGEVVIGQDGAWSYEFDQKLQPGDHVLRADRIDEKTRMPAGRASVSMRRVKPEPEVAAAPAEEPAASAPAPQEDAGSPASPAPPAADTAKPEAPQVAATEPASETQLPGFYAVKPGDTLWDIAEEYLGGGWRYKKIARQNRKLIRNPHWIYPDQEVRLPER